MSTSRPKELNPKINAQPVTLTPDAIARIRRENPNARIMEVVEKKRPNLGKFTLDQLKRCDGGLCRWLNRVANVARNEWTGFASRMGSELRSKYLSVELNVCTLVRRRMNSPSSGIPETTDHARALAFSNLFRSACSFEFFEYPARLKALEFLISSHNKWNTHKPSRSKTKSDREMVKALSDSQRMMK